MVRGRHDKIDTDGRQGDGRRVKKGQRTEMGNG